MRRRIISFLVLLPILGLMACGNVNQTGTVQGTESAVSASSQETDSSDDAIIVPEEPIPEESSAECTTEAIEETSSEDAENADSDEAADEEESALDGTTDVSTEDMESETIAQANGHLIAIDPGHSAVMPEGSEPNGPGSTEMKAADAIGTHGDASGLMEYQLTLTVCEKLRDELESRGYSVIMTREDSNHAVSCSQRAAVANDNHADVFLRVHADGSDDTSANGAMTICITSSNPFTPSTYSRSSLLSEDLIDTYCSVTGRRNRGVWYTDTMTGNNWATVPTTLIEMGFMTNASEDLWMASDEGQVQIVKGISDGLDRYFADIE